MSRRKKDGSPRKPTAKQLESAITTAKFYFSVNSNSNSTHGDVADNIIGPILWDYLRLLKLEEESMVRLRDSIPTSNSLPDTDWD